MLKDSKAFSGFSVDDLDAARAFYAGVLAWTSPRTPCSTSRSRAPVAWFKDPAGDILSVLQS